MANPLTALVATLKSIFRTRDALQFRELIRRLDTPDPRPVHSPELRRIRAIPQIGGLHHRYEQRTAEPVKPIQTWRNVVPSDRRDALGNH